MSLSERRFLRPGNAGPRVGVALLLLVLSSCVEVPPTAVPESDGVGAPSLAQAADPRAGVQVPPFRSGHLLARFLPGADEEGIARGSGAEVARDLGLGIRLLAVAPNSEFAVLQALRNNPNVEFADPDWIRTFDVEVCELCALTGDQYMGYRWDLRNDGTITNSGGSVLAETGAAGADMNWLSAFDALGPDFPGSAVVAILDTGIRGDHEELVGRVLGGYNFYNGNSNWADDDGHGTHVAGIVGARGGNGVGVAGVAWGPNIRFLSAKACGWLLGLIYQCTDSAMTQGINWAVGQGADVINISLGGAASSSSLQAALQNALAEQTLPVCAAGNSGSEGVAYPAALPECVAVSSTNWSDELASYSTWGSQIELSAPGGDLEHPSGYSYILSSYHTSPTSYVFMAGTSMASPQVAGLAALLYARGLTDAAAVRQRLRQTTEDLGPPGWDPYFGHGRIDVGAALEGLEGGGAGENLAPVASFMYECAALTCEFMDTSYDLDGHVTGWEWDFGDGAVSTDRHPSHTFADEGAYTVILRVTDDEGAIGETSQHVTLTSGGDGLVVDFAVECEDFTCIFTNESSHSEGKDLIADWDFGDGSGVVIAWDAQHTYAQEGSYEVTMVVLATDLSEWGSRKRTVTVPWESEPDDPDPDDPEPEDPEPEDPEPEDPGAITLTVTLYKLQGRNHADLEWSGATSSQVAVLRDGMQVALVQNDPDPEALNGWTHATNDRGSLEYHYAVCETDEDGAPTGVCSDADPEDPADPADPADPDDPGDGDPGDPADPDDPEPGDGIRLTVNGYKVQGRHHADLQWMGAESERVVVFRNNVAIASVVNQTAEGVWTNWTDATQNRGSAVYRYRVCEEAVGGGATEVCSAEVQVEI